MQFKLSQIQWISIVPARYEAIQGAPSGLLRSARNDDPARSGLLHSPGSQDGP
ncbi:MAG: hypothetical protein LBS88_08880 [Tannerellaceae bacterium]|nr:hypothetical protein [Tannerellaceae bacterium]